jgi:hypothetical protein
MFICCIGNAKQPNILGQMIAEAREIRENQSYRSNAATSAAAGAKQNHAEESVSKTYSVHVNDRIPKTFLSPTLFLILLSSFKSSSSSFFIFGQVGL